MPNIGSLLKDEISRLCKRVIRQEVAGVKKASATYRHEIAALKRQVATLQRKIISLEKQRTVASDSKPAELPERPARFVAKGLRSLRSRLGLSANHLALLLGVSEQSVYNWEARKATPRKQQLAGIIALRSAGRRDVQQHLDAIKPAHRKHPNKKRVT